MTIEQNLSCTELPKSNEHDKRIFEGVVSPEIQAKMPPTGSVPYIRKNALIILWEDIRRKIKGD